MLRTVLKPMALSVVSMLLLSQMACGAQGTPEKSPSQTTAPVENVKLKIYAHYTSDDEKATFDYARAEMKKIMPNVDLEVDVMPQDSGAKFKIFLATGNLPDITEVTVSDITAASNSNSIIPLDSYIQKLNLADKLSPVGQSMLKQKDGHTWAMPGANMNFAVIYANKALFEKAGAKIPTNFEELLEAGKLLRAKDIEPLGIWVKEKWPALQLFDMAAIPEDPKGMTNLDVNGTAKGTDPAFLNAAKKISELAKAGIFSKDIFTMDYNAAVAQFQSGKSAMLLCGNWMTQDFGDKFGDNATILLPNVLADASKAQAVKDAKSISGGGFPGGYAVAANSKYKDIAAEYAVQFALKQVEARVVKTGELSTVLKTAPVSEKPVNALQKSVSEVASNTKSMTIMGWAFDNNVIQTDLGSELQKLYTGQYAPETFAKNVDGIIEKNRKK